GGVRRPAPSALFSRRTGFSERAIADWEKGKAVSEPGLRGMREIERLQERLADHGAPQHYGRVARPQAPTLPRGNSTIGVDGVVWDLPFWPEIYPPGRLPTQPAARRADRSLD